MTEEECGNKSKRLDRNKNGSSIDHSMLSQNEMYLRPNGPGDTSCCGHFHNKIHTCTKRSLNQKSFDILSNVSLTNMPQKENRMMIYFLIICSLGLVENKA